MKDKEIQIKDLEKKIHLAESAVRLHYVKIGEAAYESENEKKEASTVSELMKQISDIDSKINSERERITNILNTVERSDEIDVLRKSLKNKIRSIEKDNVSNYETIGRAAYEAFKDGDLQSDKYADLFVAIVRSMSKINEAESEQKEIEDNEKAGNFFKRVKDKFRRVYLKKSVSAHYMQLKGHYKKAGENICGSDIITSLETESVENAVKPFKENLQGIEKLEKEELELNSENEKLQNDLKGFGVGANAVKTVNEIESNINLLYNNSTEAKREAGEVLYNNKNDVLAKTPKIRELIKEVRKEKDSVISCEKEIKKIEIEIEIDIQKTEKEELNKKISSCEDKISDYSQQAEQLKDKLRLTEENIKKLEDSASNGEL